MLDVMASTATEKPPRAAGRSAATGQLRSGCLTAVWARPASYSTIVLRHCTSFTPHGALAPPIFPDRRQTDSSTTLELPPDDPSGVIHRSPESPEDPARVQPHSRHLCRSRCANNANRSISKHILLWRGFGAIFGYVSVNVAIDYFP